MDPLSDTASVIEIIQIIEAITRIFRRYLNVGRVKEVWWDISLLQRQIGALSQTLEPLQTLLHSQIPTQAGLLEDIAKCSATLSRLRDKIDPETTQTLLSRWEFQRWTWPMTANDVTNVIREIERYESSFWLSLMLSKTQSHHLVHPKIDLKGVTFNDENQRIKCLPGTQVDVLRKIDNWMKSPGKCLFWLTGIAGSGKSTIARTVSSCARRQGILGASFIFKRGEQDRGNAKLLFSALAKQLGDAIPQRSSSIQHVIGKNPDIAGRGLEEQFQKLILQPLIALNPGPTSTILIVIDALDECDQDGDVRDILELLPSVQESRSVQVRFLLTSRPDLPVKLGLQHLIIHEIPNPAIEHDIRLYLNNEFSRLQQECGLPTTGPGTR
ncbi:hypothetical protein ASPVEDRAFT_149300 [Aspergillus versicolor CBS 583.65]|uniref:NACHT domain-containing protein n=1 Tax=Aspergillus versicolor CBS 583.65 TaxID=1036611 RepID=A0A1L9PFS0_ASPVE|nr:uncharacterized protein ASPVEDRAFT_149300 [Aspergillus versicolor CBS 583.65]OJJ00339.1 hypothetical protein ASPVEDRAFT_149300 [Aspergillus versicolor CBS 583.65]